MSAKHQRELPSITAAQLLPIAATIVAAGTGAETAAILTNQHRALATLITCYVLWGMATPMAMCVLVIYYQRLALHKMPPREIIVSAFLPLGPLGFGGYTIMYLGKVASTVFPATNTLDPIAGSVAYVLGFFVALIMWGFGLVWMAFALASIYMSRPFPFNMGWWGFTYVYLPRLFPSLLAELLLRNYGSRQMVGLRNTKLTVVQLPARCLFRQYHSDRSRTSFALLSGARHSEYLVSSKFIRAYED